MGIRKENSVSYSCDTEGIAEMYSTVDAKLCMAREKGSFDTDE